MIIYQGALNMGRGLELMIHSMKYIEEVTLLIAGTGDIEEELKELVIAEDLSEKVIIPGKDRSTRAVHPLHVRLGWEFLWKRTGD